MSTAKKNLMTCTPKTAVAYARYSSAGQRDVSIEQQIRDIRAFAEREGYTIIHEYADHAKSGFKNIERREQFHAMLSAAESGAFDTVIAWKVDRFGRDRRDSATYKGQLADLGVSVVYAMEPIPDGAAGCLTEGMLEAIAEWYSRNLSENTKRGLHDNALKCMSNGHASIGYERGPDGRFVIKEDEAAIVRKIYNRYLEGYNLCQITRELNNEGLKTKKGFTFRRMTVSGILENDVYIGVYRYGDVVIPDGVPPIIDKDMWETCQTMRKKAPKHGRSPEGYLLSGLCFCGYCGNKIYGGYGTSGNGRRYHYYLCSGKRVEKNCKISRKINKEDIEQPISDFLINNVLKSDILDTFFETVVKASKNKVEENPLKHLENEQKDVLRRIDNITKAISEGIWTKQTKEMLDELNKRADELKTQIAFQKTTLKKETSENRYRFIMEKFSNGDLSNYAYLRTVCHTLINSITIYEQKWLRVVLNLKENLDFIPLDELPSLEELNDPSLFDNVSCGNGHFTILEQYQVAIFQIAI